MKLTFPFLLILSLSTAAKADVLLDAGFNYSSDSLTTTTANSDVKYFYTASALLNIDKKKQWNAGWVVLGISQASAVGSATTTYSSFDMGPGLRWNIDKNNIFSLTAAYGYVAKGNYATGTTSETWDGTSLFGQFAVQVPIGEQKIFAGVSLNYYAASYTKKTVGTVSTSSSTQKTWIFPMLTLTWRP